ncbi:hypothetical protein [Qipengyuania marisflavi]|uniref:Lipoprotein n=1 Tax=Qipengyuania marisflavi TaxID=2486356 RepID=A0A5S3PXW4_9SPHN|nr:hypothetical protein [Qipengyuania marisflavi]TMM48435.1 hypothetical protein FEV51_09195 [Qipengyuania marisflavi]
MTIRTLAITAALVPALTACAHRAPEIAPQEAFWSALASHCGKAYAGGLASEDARDADWQGKRMIAHWADCSPTRIAVAFHVERDAEDGSDPEASGWDRSRTWLVTKTGTGRAARLTLKHDHRHDDGTPDAVTFYGGITAAPGTARAQDFPVDAESIALFGREGLAASLTNVWRVEVDPAGTGGAKFAYQLTRKNDPTRLFRVAIDASTPVPAPPPAWGWE